ncbi:MAG: hypothetical protein JNK78_18505 [Planctomycetes bacterium]|nr:hypothetical protein [Planctomycetota bacterium]
MRSLLPTFLLAFALPAQQAATAPALGLDDHVPWITDGQSFPDNSPGARLDKVDRMALVDQACGKAKERGTLVLWYVHRIREKTLQGHQSYRSPVLDTYARQVLFADPDVAELVSNAFVPLRCAIDQKLSDRFGLKPLAFCEPAVVFLDGDGKVVHFVERIRTFHAQWFADLCVRVLDHAGIQRHGEDVDTLRAQGLWQQALAAAAKQPGAVSLLQAARLQRLLRQPEQALDSVQKALADIETGSVPKKQRAALRADALCEQGLILSMQGRLLEAQPLLEKAMRGTGSRAAEAGYWSALDSLHLGDEAQAMQRFALVAQRHGDTLFGRRARANTTLGADDRPLGAAFAGFESIVYLPESAYHGLAKDTTWQGERLSPAAIERSGTEFLLAQQRDDGGFSDSRYAYWPDSEITPNVWVAITAIAMTALWEERDRFPDLRDRIDRALGRGENYVLDEKRMSREVNETCYADAYRLMYFSRRALAAKGEERARLVRRLDDLVQAAGKAQKANGFWAHEYDNAFATGAVLQQVLAAKTAGASVPTEMTDKAAQALLGARWKNGAYVYGGSTRDGDPTSLKDAAGRMPVCEGTLLQLGRSDLDKVRFALQNLWDNMDRLETVRRNDFHSDGELAGFFFFHSLFHASEAVLLLPAEEQNPHWQRLVAILQRIPEIDGSFLDSHELGRSYGTAMALLTLRNATRG